MTDRSHRRWTGNHRVRPFAPPVVAALAVATLAVPGPGVARASVSEIPAAPAVLGISPASGPVAGGVTVTITGTGLSGATKVVFGTVAAASFAVVSDSQVTAVSPVEAAATPNIRVTTPGGTSPVVPADRFTVKAPAPTVTGVTPDWGSVTGGSTVTITGTGLSRTTKVLFGAVAATSFAIVSDSQVTAVSPALTAGVRNIRIITPSGMSPITPAGGFTPQPVGYPFCGTLQGPPTTTKLMVIYEENRNASAIYGSAAAPDINAYAADCGSAQNYQSLTHPSLPNYLASTSGVSYASAPWNTDCVPGGTCLTANENIFDQVGVSGWRSYVESMSGNCSSTGTDYLARHNPALYYTDLDSACAIDDVPMGTPASGPLAEDVASGTLPTFSTVTPDVDDDMHDGSTAQGDAWLAGWIPVITAGPDYQSGDLTIVIVWDEGSGSGNVASTVPMIVLSPYITPGTTSSTPFTHDSLLKAAEDVAGVPELAGAYTAGDLRTAFGF
jgi:hypothetical protein